MTKAEAFTARSAAFNAAYTIYNTSCEEAETTYRAVIKAFKAPLELLNAAIDEQRRATQAAYDTRQHAEAAYRTALDDAGSAYRVAYKVYEASK